MINAERAAVDYVFRFLAGGLIVSAFAVLGDVLRPKSFAGLFGAAPSVAVATLSLAFLKEGSTTVAIESRSMVLGALAFLLFSVVVCHLLMRFRTSAVAATGSTLILWLVAACGLKLMVLG
jgi:Protein of unknown function (DUF3147)